MLVPYFSLPLSALMISKCSVLSILHNSKASIPHSYYINGTQLFNTSSVTDLGILVDSRLTFNLHISNILTKATQRVGVFFRGFSSRHPELIRKAFITYIRLLCLRKSCFYDSDTTWLEQLKHMTSCDD